MEKQWFTDKLFSLIPVDSLFLLWLAAREDGEFKCSEEQAEELDKFLVENIPDYRKNCGKGGKWDFHQRANLISKIWLDSDIPKLPTT